MPRITAPSVAAHVAQQEEAVFRAAIALFIERGYDAVTLGDIAAAVGLARNSLYRYFPSKSDILLRWFAQELTGEVERAQQLLSGAEPPAARIQRWALAQLDYAKTPEHALIATLTSRVADLDEQARAGLADSHRQLQEPLDHTLRAAGITRKADRSAIADLIGGLVTAAARHEARAQHATPARQHLIRAINALLAAG